MKKNNIPKSLRIIFVIIIFCGIGMIALNKKTDSDIDIDKNTFDCQYVVDAWNCVTRFTLINNSNLDFSGRLSVRTVALKQRTKSTETLISDPTLVDFEINGYQEKSFVTNTRSFERKPTGVNITITNKLVVDH